MIPISVAMGREADALLTVSIRRFLTRAGIGDAVIHNGHFERQRYFFYKNRYGFVGEICRWENIDGREDREAPCVDEGRHLCTQDARAREDKDNGDRTQIEAKHGSDASESNETWCDVGGRSEEGVNGSCDCRENGHL